MLGLSRVHVPEQHVSVHELENCAFAECLPSYTGDVVRDINLSLPLSAVVSVTQDSYLNINQYQPSFFIDTVTNFVHSASNVPNPWIQVEFSEPVVLLSFVLINRGTGNFRLWRTDSGDTGSGFVVRVSSDSCTNETCPGTVCYAHTETTDPGFANNEFVISCATPTAARYMSIQLPGSSRILNLDGIRNLMQSTGPFSFVPPTCSVNCELATGCAYESCAHDPQQIGEGPYPCLATGCYPFIADTAPWPAPQAQGFDASTATCQACNTDSQYITAELECVTCPCDGPCQANAVQLTLTNAAQSSTYSGEYAAVNAIDGDFSGVTFSHTAAGADFAFNPWWQAEIQGGIQRVSGLTLVNRRGCGARWWVGGGCSAQLEAQTFEGDNQGFIVKIANESCTGTTCPGVVCYTGNVYSGNYANPVRLDVVCPTGLSGMYVNFMLLGRSRSLQIAEVAAYTMNAAPTCT